MSKKRVPKLYVVFDTNALYTQVASELVRKDVYKIISNNSEHPDLEISWCLPEVVIGERRYQMIERAKELLPNMQKLERLIGHKFGVGEDTLEMHVDRAINENCINLNLKKIGLNTEKVDWKHIIDCSVSRKPPFEATAKEKGFRDSIIAHTFLQLLEQSPSTPNICRLALVSEDTVLRQYVKDCTTYSKNVRILSTLDELENLINTLVSTIPEDFAAELSKKAEKLFFEKGNNKTFYYKEMIGEKIREQYSNELNETILPGSSRDNGTWWIVPPIFKNKNKQRIYWVSSIEPEFEILHYEKIEQNQQPQLGLGNFLATRSEGSNTDTQASASSIQLGLNALMDVPPMKRVTDFKGREKFEVHWSANLSKAHNLTSPKLEEIKYLGNNVGETNS